MKLQRRRLVEYPSFPLKINIQMCLLVCIYVEDTPPFFVFLVL